MMSVLLQFIIRHDSRNISMHYDICDSDSDSVFISIIRIYTITSTAFTMGGIVLRTIVDIG